MSPLGDVVLFVVRIVTARADVEGVGLAETGTLSGCGAFGFDSGFLVLIGCLGLLEDIDNMLALVDFDCCQRLPVI